MTETEPFSFYLPPSLVEETLDKIDPQNRSRALRIVLESNSRYTKRKQRKNLLDKMFVLLGLGLLFFVFSLTTTQYQTPIQLIGFFIIVYAIIGGILDGIQTQRQ